jgi:hypothetical protein
MRTGDDCQAIKCRNKIVVEKWKLRERSSRAERRGQAHSEMCNQLRTSSKCKDPSWWPGTDLNRRRRPFQGRALPLSYLANKFSVTNGSCGPLHSQAFCSASRAEPLSCSTAACRLLPCASMVTIAANPSTRNCHIASGIPNSSRFTPRTSRTVRA